ncbi:MAG: hypothetical protein J6R82_02890 [Clostridia bacterium]|nr:hypothetical protein [Clostridia bacterium]
MKKIAFLLALMTAATMCLASCNNAADDTTTTPAATTTTPAASTTTKTPPPVIDVPKTEEETKAPDLADGSKFVLDGNLAEWEGLHTISVIGEKSAGGELDTSHKKVTFYGVMTDLGLFLACDSYHDVYTVNPDGEWWTNSNFEFFVGLSSTQKYVYAQGVDQECGTSGDGTDIKAKMVTEVLTDGPSAYHTVTEVLIPFDYLVESDILYNTIDVGVAWKTVGDLIIGGHGTAGAHGSDEYWVPKGNFPWDSPKPIVAPSGIYLPGDYEF